MLRVLLDENNDFPIGGPQLVSGMDSAATALRATFSTQTGEWPFNKTFGCPWRGSILGKFFDPATTSSICAAVANTWVPDIQPITGNQITIDTIINATQRQVDITIDAVTVDGEQLDLTLQTTI